MPTLEWKDQFSVHIPRLDQDHKQLFELLRQFRDSIDCRAADSMASPALDRLIRYAESHLQREELILRARGYPEYAAHKAEHDDYRTKVAALRARDIESNRGMRVANFLIDWWHTHITTSDRQYASYFARIAAAPAVKP